MLYTHVGGWPGVCIIHSCGYQYAARGSSNCDLNTRFFSEAEVNVEKTKYMVISRDLNTVQNGYIQIGNKSFELWNSLNIWEQP